MKCNLRSWIVAGSVAASVLVGASAANATVFNGITMDQLKQVLTELGANVSDLGPGRLQIENGPVLWLTQCSQTTCYEIEMSESFSDVKPSLAAINQWNGGEKVAKATIDKDGLLRMEYWVTTVGMTEQLLADSIGWFEGSIEAGAKFWKPYLLGPGV